MLIVPAEHKPDIRRLPIVTLLLFVACVLIFSVYQTGDQDRIAVALETYAEQGLAQWEEILLREYAVSEHGIAGDAEVEELIGIAVSPAFDAYVREHWNQLPATETWREARMHFEQQRNRISWIRFGFVPSDVKPGGVVAHMFMHGGWDHLIGNMIFLLLFGLALERVLGPMFFLVTYVLTGLAAVSLFALTHMGSHVPLVGASGAISGLMGAYLGVYGLRRIRFFYTIGFWFGQFTAPALLIFPLWLLKELHGHFFVDGPVAYMAHAGGLLGGLALALLMKKHATHAIEQDDEAQRRDHARTERLRRIRQLLTDLRLDEAARSAQQAVAAAPDEPEYWHMYAQVAWRMPAGEQQQRMIANIFMNATRKTMSVEFLRTTLREYQEKHPEIQKALAGKAGATLALRFFREGGMRDVDALLDGLSRSNGLTAEFTELLRTLTQFAEKNRDRRRADRYQKYLAGASSE